MRAYKGVDLLRDAWPVSSPPSHRPAPVVGKVLDPAVRDDLEGLRALPRVEVVEAYVSVSRMLDSYAVADVVVFPYHRISQSAGLMTAAGLGRPSVITPVDGLLEQAPTLTGTTVADDATGPAVAAAVISTLGRLDERQAAAEHDRVAIAASPVGWPASLGGRSRPTRAALEDGPAAAGRRGSGPR